MLGTALARLPTSSPSILAAVSRLQHELFLAQTELAAPTPTSRDPIRIQDRHVVRLEQELDRLAKELPPLKTFVLSRGAPGAAELHHARTVARRAERELWTLQRVQPLRPELLRWANRLSALLFALALQLNHEQHVAEEAPDYTI